MTRGASNSSPRFGHHAADALATGADQADPLAGPDLSALREEGLAQRLDDRAHAADRQPRRAAQGDAPRIVLPAVPQRSERDRAHHQVPGRAGGRGARLPPHDRQRSDQCLRLRREAEFVHQVAGAAEQDARERLLILKPRKVADQVLQAGRRLEDRDAQAVGEALQVAEERVVAGRLAWRVAVKLGVVAGGIAPADV